MKKHLNLKAADKLLDSPVADDIQANRRIDYIPGSDKVDDIFRYDKFFWLDKLDRYSIERLGREYPLKRLKERNKNAKYYDLSNDR